MRHIKRKQESAAAVLAVLAFVAAGSTSGFAKEPFGHIPGEIIKGQQLEIRVGADNALEARVLVFRAGGIESIQMEPEGESFSTQIDPGESDVLSFTIQKKLKGGHITESEMYTIFRGLTEEEKRALSALEEQSRVLTTRERQLENAIKELSETDVNILGRGAEKELKKARVMLKEKKEQLEKLTVKSNSDLMEFNRLRDRTKKGKKIKKLRETIKREYKLLWKDV